jgi:DNA polymerase III subunit gamma/tau
MSQAFYRKWRPQRWDQVVGQEHVVQTLRNAVAAGRIGHAYLFAGPRGTGKTTTARLLAKAANCMEEVLTKRPCDHCEHCQAVNQGRFLDLIEIDAASNTSVEDVRDLRDKINFSPNQGQFKVYIIDEVHMLSTAAFNALLKTLEEPPKHAIFILATTEVHKIPATVLSRCQRHEFRRISVREIVALLKEMMIGEGIKADEEALMLIARQSTGSMRDAISLVDQLSSTGKKITVEMTQAVLGTAASQAVIELVEELIKGNPAKGLDQIHGAIDAGSDPRQFGRQVVEYLRSLLLIRMNNAGQVEATAETKATMARHAQSFQTPDLLAIIRIFNLAASDARVSWQPALPLELAYVEAIERQVRGEPEPVKVSAAKPAATPAPRTLFQENASAVGEERTDEEPGEPEGQPESGLTMELIGQHWKQVLSLVRQHNPQTQGLLNSCKPLGIKDGILVLGFNSDFSKTKMEKKEHTEVTQRVLAEVYEMVIPIRCIVAASRRGTPPPDIESNGMVATAVRDLGGEIIDIQ